MKCFWFLSVPVILLSCAGQPFSEEDDFLPGSDGCTGPTVITEHTVKVDSTYFENDTLVWLDFVSIDVEEKVFWVSRKEVQGISDSSLLTTGLIYRMIQTHNYKGSCGDDIYFEFEIQDSL